MPGALQVLERLLPHACTWPAHAHGLHMDARRRMDTQTGDRARDLRDRVQERQRPLPHHRAALDHYQLGP